MIVINVMDEYISFTKKCFHQYLKFILDSKYDKKIADVFIEAYVNVRYSNYIDESNKKLSLQRKIQRVLSDTAKQLVSENEHSKADVISYTQTFCSYFYHLDQLYLLESQKVTIHNIDQDRSKLIGISDTNFVNQFSSLLREDIKKRKDYLDSFDSNVFSLAYTKLVKNEFLVRLENSIVFPELYSDVAIKKAAEKESISEDMTAILYLQTACTVVKDLISCDFDKIYYVDFPETLFDKKTKINRVFRSIDNVFLQDKIRIVITYQCFMRYKAYVREYMRQGFFFAIKLDDSFDYSSDNIEYLELFEKVFIDSSKYYYKDMKNNVKIKNRVVSVDEVK